MNNEKSSLSWKWRVSNLIWWVVLALIGFALGIYQSDRLYQPGCKLTIHFYPPSLETNCPSPFETKINFGSPAFERTLADALGIVQERTQSKGQARIYVDKSVLNAAFSATKVNPPTGAQGSISVVQQILEDAGVSNKVDICLARTGGFRLIKSNKAGLPD